MIEILQEFFKELIILMTSNFNSKFLYNSAILQSRDLKEMLEQAIFVASYKALKLCIHYFALLIS
jgi:hypothetical protein